MKTLMLAAFAAFSLAAAVAPMANAAPAYTYSHSGHSAVSNSGSQFVGGGDGGNG